MKLDEGLAAGLYAASAANAARPDGMRQERPLLSSALEAHSVNQAYVLAVQPISPSRRYVPSQPSSLLATRCFATLGSLSHGRVVMLIRLIVSEQCPRSSCHFVCQRYCRHIYGPPQQYLIAPGSLVLAFKQNGACPVNQQHPYIVVASLTYAAQPDLATGTGLPWNESEVCCQFTP